MMNRITRSAALTVLLVGLAGPLSADSKTDFFESKIRPALIQHCYECHSGDSKALKGGLRLDHRAGWQIGGDSGPALVPGKPAESLLLKALEFSGETSDMPPKGKLPDAVIADFRRWIESGAPDPRDPPAVKATAKHETGIDLAAGRKWWAFQPLKATPAPEVHRGRWPASDIDHFILHKLEAAGLHPVQDADRWTLLRRVTLDLTGLPPTAAEIEAFTRDPAPTPVAFAAVVDRLLAAPAFGDRWGRHWLDLAMYADTVSVDRMFPDRTAWRYRDYVIAAFNADKPFPNFVREQLAGDLLPADSDRERQAGIIATAFLTQGPMQTINQFKEQLRADIVDMQVSKVGAVFLGMTLQCARCHDHKFDPIPQADYYALTGILGNVKVLNGFLGESKVFSDWERRPIPEMPAERAARAAITAEHAKIAAEVERDLVVQNEKLAGLKEELKQLSAIETPSDSELSRKDTLEKQAAEQQLIATKALRTRDNHVKANPIAAPTMFAASEPAKPSNARITIRGNAYQLGAEVPRGVLQVVSERMPTIPSNASGRKELADWLTDSANPLTDRVFVNRVWRHLFGAGLVKSVDNFGIRGDLPSHPELLDNLVLQFRADGGSVKRLIRRLVLSRTYQLSSDHDPHAVTVDPENRLRWRMDRRRLEAEAIRDSILSVSGDLDGARGGPALALPIWAPGAVQEYPLLKGEAEPPATLEKRRSVYLPVTRRLATWAEGLTLFNVAPPVAVMGDRPVTTVPPQSLYLMNSEFLIKQGEKAADRWLAQTDLSDEQRLSGFLLIAYGRPALPTDLTRALDFLDQQTSVGAAAGAEPTAARRQAWAMFCHAVFASNEFLFRL